MEELRLPTNVIFGLLAIGAMWCSNSLHAKLSGLISKDKMQLREWARLHQRSVY